MRTDCDAYEHLRACVCTVRGICEATCMCMWVCAYVHLQSRMHQRGLFCVCMCVWINVTGVKTGCNADLVPVINTRLVFTFCHCSGKQDLSHICGCYFRISSLPWSSLLYIWSQKPFWKQANGEFKMNKEYIHKKLSFFSLTTPFWLLYWQKQFFLIITDSSNRQGRECVSWWECVCTVHGQGAGSRETGQLSVAGLHLIWMSQRPT